MNAAPPLSDVRDRRWYRPTIARSEEALRDYIDVELATGWQGLQRHRRSPWHVEGFDRAKGIRRCSGCSGWVRDLLELAAMRRVGVRR